MPRGKPKTTTATHPDVRLMGEQTPEQVRAILWGIASDSEQSGTARVSACALLLRDARECGDDGESRQDADLNKRALALMRRVTN